MPEAEKTDLVKQIDGIVDLANHSAEWRRGYMTYLQAQMDAMNRGREEGIAIGRMKTFYELVMDGTFTISVAAKKAQVTETAFAAGLEEYKKTRPVS